MDKISIVTGGSSGLGLEITKELLKNNKKVCIIGRDEKKLNKVCNELGVLGFAGDISDQDFVLSVYKELSNREIEHLFNVAGLGKFGSPDSVTKKDVEDVLSSNTIGLILMSSNVLKIMKNQDYGTIINVMSSSAKKGNPNESIYCAAKWAARGYTESLLAWSKGTNIKIIGVYPGGIKTPFWDRDTGQNPDTSTFMSPSEVAEEIVSAVLNKKTLKITDLTIERL